MNVLESMKEQRLNLVIYTISVVACTWAVVFWLIIEPRNFIIGQQRQELNSTRSELTETRAKLDRIVDQTVPKEQHSRITANLLRLQAKLEDLKASTVPKSEHEIAILASRQATQKANHLTEDLSRLEDRTTKLTAEKERLALVIDDLSQRLEERKNNSALLNQLNLVGNQQYDVEQEIQDLLKRLDREREYRSSRKEICAYCPRCTKFQISYECAESELSKERVEDLEQQLDWQRKRHDVLEEELKQFRGRLTIPQDVEFEKVLAPDKQFETQ